MIDYEINILYSTYTFQILLSFLFGFVLMAILAILISYSNLSMNKKRAKMSYLESNDTEKTDFNALLDKIIYDLSGLVSISNGNYFRHIYNNLEKFKTYLKEKYID